MLAELLAAETVAEWSSEGEKSAASYVAADCLAEELQSGWRCGSEEQRGQRWCLIS